MGGQLAAQALANAAAAVVFWFALKLKLVSYIPTALRIGAGYGVATVSYTHLTLPTILLV